MDLGSFAINGESVRRLTVRSCSGKMVAVGQIVALNASGSALI